MRLLIAEDDPKLLKSLVYIFKRNQYAAVDEVELKRLFDRFYRADKARTYQGGCGVGLSMAKAIAEKHKGEIGAYRKDSGHIGFSVVLPR